MLKQAVALALWFLSGWTLGNFLALAAGTPELLGPVLGLAAALFVALGVRRPVWRARAAVRS